MSEPFGPIQELLDRVRARWRRLVLLEVTTRGALAGTVIVGFAFALSFWMSRAPLALAATLLALALGIAQRHGGGGRVLPLLTRVVSLGYAMPGAVIAVGILLPLGWVQQRWPQSGAGLWASAAFDGSATIEVQ